MQPSETRLIRKSCRRENVPGHAHFLTFSCYQQKPFLSRDRSRQWLVDSISEALKKHHLHLWAYVIMPEHVHLVLFPLEDGYSISAILSSIKQPVAKRAANFVRKNAPEFISQMEDRGPDGTSTLRFWQRGGGYDRNLYSFDETWEKIQYVHENPVERKLVSCPVDYQWSSAADFEGVRKGPIPLDWTYLPR